MFGAQQMFGIRRFVDFDEAGVPVLSDDESIAYRLENVEVAFSEDEILGLGNLFITSRRLVLIGNEFSLDIDIPFIGLHAISRSLDSYPKPCIYCQLCSEDEDDGANELFLAPADDSTLRVLFDVFCKAAENNPDPPEDGEEEGDDELIYDLNEVALGAKQSEMLAHLESVFVLPEDQFEDASEGAGYNNEELVEDMDENCAVTAEIEIDVEDSSTQSKSQI